MRTQDIAHCLGSSQGSLPGAFGTLEGTGPAVLLLPITVASAWGCNPVHIGRPFAHLFQELVVDVLPAQVEMCPVALLVMGVLVDLNWLHDRACLAPFCPLCPQRTPLAPVARVHVAGQHSEPLESRCGRGGCP